MKNQLVSLKSPLSVNFEVTPYCDLRCVFCFNATEECRQLAHPSLEHIKAILNALLEAEVFEVRLFGGEFFTHPNWQEIVEYADSLDFFLSFVSNGIHLTTDVVQKLKQHRIIHGAISLHGTKEIYELITCVPGSFNSTVKGIKTCLAESIGISILYTLTRQNFLKIFETVVWLKNHGIEIDEINVGRLTPYGRARSDWDAVKLSFNDYLMVFPQLLQIRDDLGLIANFGDAFPICLLPKEFQEFVVGCWQGTGFAHINYLGDVRSCSIARGSYGNILQTPLTEIWQKELQHFRSLDWLPKKCQICETFCGGGCSASCYEGGMYAPDEFISKWR